LGTGFNVEADFGKLQEKITRENYKIDPGA
jgi:hypothetical protein